MNAKDYRLLEKHDYSFYAGKMYELYFKLHEKVIGI